MLRAKHNWIFLYRLLPFPEDVIYCVFKHLPKYYTVKRVKQVVLYRLDRKQKYYLKHRVR